MHWKQASQAVSFLSEFPQGMKVRKLFIVQLLSRVKLKTFHLLWKCPQMRRKWRKNMKCFLRMKKMQTLAKA